MDVVVYAPRKSLGYNVDLLDWLSLVHDQDLQVFKRQLLHLKGKGLFEDVDKMWQRNISVHDLYQEFARLKSIGKLNERVDFEKRNFVYYEDLYPTELGTTPSHRCWQKLIRIGIEESYENGKKYLVQSLQWIEWSNYSNVAVLKLTNLWNLQGDLNLHGLKCLRSLELRNVSKLNSLDGLKDLNHLTFFQWYNGSSDDVLTRLGQLPSSLKLVALHIKLFLRPDSFIHCTHLLILSLQGCDVHHLDFNNLKHLHTLHLGLLRKLEALTGLSAASTPSLKSFEVWCCDNLLEIPGLGDLVGLQSLYLCRNSGLQKLPDLQKLTNLQVLKMLVMKNLEEAPGLGCLLQLRELHCGYLKRFKLPILSALKQLVVVDFSGLSSLDGVLVDLSALRSLDLSGCSALKQLPDLQRMTSLEELFLTNSGIEIGEDDLCMLAALPLLHPLSIGTDKFPFNMYKLDVVRRKVLKRVDESYQGSYLGEKSWMKWEENDLGILPIKVGDISLK